MSTQAAPRRPSPTATAETQGFPPSAAIEHGQSTVPTTVNEPVRDYAPGSPERESIVTVLRDMTGTAAELPLVIGGKDVATGRLEDAIVPHRHAHRLGRAHLAGRDQILAAVAAAKHAWPDWSRAPWQERASVFLKAADLLAGPWRDRLNAATMLGQSKTIHQAEIDAAAELVDFWRFNVEFMLRIYREQPISSAGTWNRMDYRPLEGFVLAITPFNFTSIAGNLPSAPALMGNTVVWKPASTAKLSAHLIMRILQEAGLPDGVINLVYGSGAEIAETAMMDPCFAGLHFTGSTEVFNGLARKAAERTGAHKNYPRLVGETGGKNFIIAHASADITALATAVIRGGFEYQGQKCSAASRVFVPRTKWAELRARLCDEIATIGVGDVSDFKNFMGAVIDETSWRKQAAVFAEAKSSPDSRVLCGGTAAMNEGYFVSPTIIETTDPRTRFMTEEFFGPIVTVYVFDDLKFESVVAEVDETSRYGLTGSVFATDRTAIRRAANSLRHAAGNFYVNDKPTGAVVGQQPFGGARASGTNDKAGSLWNLMRWVSPRAVKETFSPPRDYRYPFMA